MKTVISVSPEERKSLLLWALKNDRADMWNERGVFCSAKAVYYMFRRGLEMEEKNLS